ncbi:MAG TPA: hypothetical protein PKM73_05825 [Verrucomicrobiota bacterium]|nr:hypothetical protein [Verrucomicrobiota bacterium]HNU50493.1 hypothetical protein [Verrucomicrobiota bacterium]
MNPLSAFALAVLCGGVALSCVAQTGPFDPEQWPASVDPARAVHYVVTDGGFSPPDVTWIECCTILSGGDQETVDFTIGGHKGRKVAGSYLNIADPEYGEWADEEFIDILVQVYGDAGLFSASGQARNFSFLIGTLPAGYHTAPVGGLIPLEAKNKRWNWVLFRIPNNFRPDSERYCGTIPAMAEGDTRAGGINGGTIRFQMVPGLTVRVVAFGQQGAFGTPEDINQFLPVETCDPEPETNLVGIDVAAGTSDHMVVLGGHDHTTTLVDDVGPLDDKRRAVVPDGIYLNFGITDNYLGFPCNDPQTVKVCVDYYDDPAFAGANVSFGPEAYATDDKGSIGFYPAAQRATLEGSGVWIRRSWVIPSVNLKGVNADAYTAGPRFVSNNGAVAVSRFELAILRTGTHPLAGDDPLAGCLEDPNVCTDKYGSFVELDLARDVRNGLDVGTSGADQEMIIDEAGPVADRRLAVRPAFDDGTPGFTHQYLNFAILDQALGPSSQPPARLAICVTYYDDPALAGVQFKPDVYSSIRNGLPAYAYPADSYLVTLEGTDTWRTAYWEIQDMKFNGVNQGPQAAARFAASGKVFFASVKYAVIRPCGPMAGVNQLESCKPITDVSLTVERVQDSILVSWPAAAQGFAVQVTPSLANPDWQPADAPVEVVGDRNVVSLQIGPSTEFFRLAK